MGSEFMSRNNRRTAQRPATRYVLNPYSEQSFDVVNTSTNVPAQNRDVAKKFLPEGTMRLDLFGQMSFATYPEHVLDRTRQRTEAPPLEERPDSLVQLFFGQLPYKVSDNMILWLTNTFAGCDVLYIERVMQDKSRKGCMQVFVNEDAAEKIIQALNRRVLFDATGLWYAQSDDQTTVLEQHCAAESNRHKGLPFRMMVVERSTSTYVRRHKQPVTHRSRSATPPPSIIEDEYAEPLPIDGSITEEPAPCMCPCCTSAVPYSSFDPYCVPQQYNYGYYAPQYDMPYGPYDAPPHMMPAIYGSY